MILCSTLVKSSRICSGNFLEQPLGMHPFFPLTPFINITHARFATMSSPSTRDLRMSLLMQNSKIAMYQGWQTLGFSGFNSSNQRFVWTQVQKRIIKIPDKTTGAFINSSHVLRGKSISNTQHRVMSLSRATRDIRHKSTAMCFYYLIPIYSCSSQKLFQSPFL